ncbi:hypothetical protein ACFYXF_46665 [Streptomyces sp. NPDC002680]|uniref:hypothetical protein n=1 Tax=Streptomyces sp. NPDC002680 TaxID=3364659 RepID=UPI0036C42291
MIILTGAGEPAFCSGGDQRVCGDTGYVSEPGRPGRFHVTDLHVQIPVAAQARGSPGHRPRGGRGTGAAAGVRPGDRRRHRPLRPDRPPRRLGQGRVLRRALHSACWGAQGLLELSPFALRLLKASFHTAEDGLAGIQQVAHDANRLFYGSEEAEEDCEVSRRNVPPTSRGSRAVPEPVQCGGRQ